MSSRGKHAQRRRGPQLNPLVAVIIAVVALAAIVLVMNMGEKHADVTTVQAVTALPVVETAASTAVPTAVPTAVAPSALPTEAPTAEPAATAEPTSEPRAGGPRSATIRACGDIMAHDQQLKEAKTGSGTYSFAESFAYITDSLSAADLTIANLETTIGLYGSHDYSGYPQFNTPEALLEAMKGAGIDFLTLANNHMLDRWFDGMKQTADYVDQYGFGHVGSNRSQQEKDTPVIVDVNGIKIGMLAYTEFTNDMEKFCDSAAVEYGVNYLRKADFAADVQKLRAAGAEVVIAIPHWGTEYVMKHESYVVEFAREFAEAGVDVVIGSHPHVVQSIEWVNAQTADGAAHRTLVIYSLGNFLSDMSQQYTYEGIIAQFTISEQADGSFVIENPAYVPTYVCRDGDRANKILPIPYTIANRPSGMSDADFSDMKTCLAEVQKQVGDTAVMLDK